VHIVENNIYGLLSIGLLKLLKLLKHVVRITYYCVLLFYSVMRYLGA